MKPTEQLKKEHEAIKLMLRILDAVSQKLESGEKINLEEVFYLTDERLEAPSQTFYFEGGLQSMVRFYNEFQKPVHRNVFYVEKN